MFRIIGLAATFAAAATTAGAEAASVEFNRDVLPILSDACLHCHGPDAASRKADLRLDREEFAFAERDGGPVIVRGNPDQSPLVHRILSQDPDEAMPPPDSHKSITDVERQTLVTWIEQGAPWQEHWAFVPPSKPIPPDAPSGTHPIDAFLAAEWENQGLTATPKADRHTLFRRMHLALLGLPPSPAAVASFIADDRPEALEEWMDRLMASPQYGEHMARYWLDAARYGDTHGLHLDNLRIMWPYRDWVIDAFNHNMPFDQFTVEQIAGDLLPDPSMEQQIATGFHRCLVTTSEGGAIREEFRVRYGVDRTHTTGQVWLGLTMECASCHDHKYDPISQKDFYSMFAFFDNTTMPVMDNNRKDTPPVINVPLDEDRQRYFELQDAIPIVREELKRLEGLADQRFEQWNTSRELTASITPEVTLPLPVFHAYLAEGQGNQIRERAGDRTLQLEGKPTTAWTASSSEPNIAGEAEAGSPDGWKSDLGSGPAAAVDGDPETFWDEENRKPLYLFTLTFEQPRLIQRIRLSGIQQHRRAARDFSVWLDDQQVVEVRNAQYADNQFEVMLPDGSKGTQLRLEITGYYGVSPAIRELEVYPPARRPELTAALKLDGKHHVDAGDVGDFGRDQSFSWGGWLYSSHGQGKGPLLSRMNEKEGFRGWDLYLDRNKVVAHLISGWPENTLRGHVLIPPNRWTHVLFTYDGSSSRDGLTAWVNGEAADLSITHDTLSGSIRSKAPLQVGKRIHSEAAKGALVRDLRVYRGVLNPSQVRAVMNDPLLPQLLAWKELAPEDLTALKTWYTFYHDTDGLKQARLVSDLEQEMADIKARGTTTMVMAENPDSQPMAHIRERGAYDAYGDEVQPAIPEVFGALPDDQPRNRMGLANWLVDSENPLTARVTVNRIWQQFFGRGLVATPGDFGLQGARPSHLELLDWLAVDFVENGWDVKRLVRQILRTEAWQRSPRTTPGDRAKDPDNIWLARGARFRLDAEVIRDQILSTSGMLVDTVGGEPVKPYQPGGIWQAVAYSGSNTKIYQRDDGDDLYRRSLYTFWKRTAPPAQLAVFDAPSRETCTVIRERTNTPMQALALMNDTQYVEAARHLAGELLTQGPATSAERIHTLGMRVLARPLSQTEREVVHRSLTRLHARYKNDPEAARKLIQVGESDPPSAVDATELAMWTMVASQLLNLDEFISQN